MRRVWLHTDMAADLDFERPLIELVSEIEHARKQLVAKPERGLSQKIADLEQTLQRRQVEIFSNLTPWQKVQLARHIQRPRFLDYAHVLFTEFVELHGDRKFGDDHAILGGLAHFDGQSVMVIGQQKGKSTRENVERNFGMPRPEGYRKALRLMRMAEKFRLPVFTFVDTGGASPGLTDEEHGQAWAIAENLYAMAELRVPLLVTVIGEGGSGGALGIALGDRVQMMQYAVYAVASPESCASITWKDAGHAPDAAAQMRVTAPDLLDLGLIDRIVQEPPGGAHRDAAQAAMLLRQALRQEVADMGNWSHDVDGLVERRYDRYRRMSRFTEATG